jgi:hypothetical protein
MGSRYALGTQAWGLCKRCGLQFLLRNLVFDGYMPGLRVCVDCYDGRHPQEYPIDCTDPVGLWKSTSDDPPYGAVLSLVLVDGDSIDLAWTAPNTSGNARYETYTLSRASSPDGDVFTSFAVIRVFPVIYDAFGAILSQVLAFDDTVGEPGFYQYILSAQTTRGGGPSSNILTVNAESTVGLRLLEDAVTFRVLEDGVTFRALES